MSNIDNYKRLLYKSLTMDYEIDSNTMSFLKVKGDDYAVSVFISHANFSFKLEIINGCVNVYNTKFDGEAEIYILTKKEPIDGIEVVTYYLTFIDDDNNISNITMNYETMSGDIEVVGTTIASFEDENLSEDDVLLNFNSDDDNNIIISTSTFKIKGDFEGNATSADTVYISFPTIQDFSYNIPFVVGGPNGGNNRVYMDKEFNFKYNPDTNTLNVPTVDTSTLNASYINIASDKRLKENIVPFTDTDIISKIKAVNIVNYNYINQDQESIGVLAQDFEEIFPELVSQSRTEKYDDQRSISETKLVYILWKGIQEQQKMIESLQEEVNKTKKKRWFKKKVSE